MRALLDRLGLAAAALAMAMPASAQGKKVDPLPVPTRPVEVVNPANRPVPVSGSVNVRQGGDWFVRFDPAGNVVRLEDDAVITVRDVDSAAGESVAVGALQGGPLRAAERAQGDAEGARHHAQGLQDPEDAGGRRTVDGAWSGAGAFASTGDGKGGGWARSGAAGGMRPPGGRHTAATCSVESATPRAHESSGSPGRFAGTMLPQ